MTYRQLMSLSYLSCCGHAREACAWPERQRWCCLWHGMPYSEALHDTQNCSKISKFTSPNADLKTSIMTTCRICGCCQDKQVRSWLMLLISVIWGCTRSFPLIKVELHNHTWTKLHCDVPLSTKALIFALKLAFYFLYILSETFKWWYMDSIALWCGSSLKSNVWKEKGFAEITLSYTQHPNPHHVSC